MNRNELLKKADELRAKMELAALHINDNTALECVELYPRWKAGEQYDFADRVQYNTVLFKCVQAHIAQVGWTPENAPALWTVVSFDIYPQWVRPYGIQNAYNTGDGCTYNGGRYESVMDGNVWSPDEYPAGWTEV